MKRRTGGLGVADARAGGAGFEQQLGHALHSFAGQYLDAIGPRTTLLILGDARDNYGDARLDARSSR